MKTSLRIILIFICSCIGCSYSEPGIAQNKDSKMSNAGPAIVELFTSEGCSSCPSADALMPLLKAQFKDKVIILSFHVDYWNRLGWQDVYSNKEFSNRQNLYATAFKSDNVYTPQAIVNGKDQTTGSNKQALSGFIKEAASSEAETIAVTAIKRQKAEVVVAYKTKLGRGQSINLALVQLNASSNVSSGENSGRVLQHYNVVRDFRSLSNGNGEATFSLPDQMTAGEFHVVAFVQRMDDMHIISAQEISIQ